MESDFNFQDYRAFLNKTKGSYEFKELNKVFSLYRLYSMYLDYCNKLGYWLPENLAISYFYHVMTHNNTCEINTYNWLWVMSINIRALKQRIENNPVNSFNMTIWNRTLNTNYQNWPSLILRDIIVVSIKGGFFQRIETNIEKLQREIKQFLNN